GNTFVQKFLFTPSTDQESDLVLTAGSPQDHEEMVGLWVWAAQHVFGAAAGAQFTTEELQELREWMAPMLKMPGVWSRVQRDSSGRLANYALSFSICQQTLPQLLRHPNAGPLLRAYWTPSELEQLPATPEESNLWWHAIIPASGFTPDAALAAMYREWFGLCA